ncbi:hypothetical protein SSP531S_21150 [Streptomyces spongiicola]|uniref:Uncharacterized protein n=1 Tax=Streptomyces spongiicola TaxID=1690221 RepID=A0A2S1Z235_9ACTN|nr:hypothetical protein DDQ41_16975 [Streptomyces spongiicola]GBQ00697.1 hypothetical protein SSP531S_21150 [Streptomyces spongiicola]
MTRMVRALCAIAVAAALGGLAASGEPTWESAPMTVTATLAAAPGEPTWDSAPANAIAGEPTWDSASANAAPGEPTWDSAPADADA